MSVTLLFPSITGERFTPVEVEGGLGLDGLDELSDGVHRHVVERGGRSCLALVELETGGHGFRLKTSSSHGPFELDLAFRKEGAALHVVGGFLKADWVGSRDGGGGTTGQEPWWEQRIPDQQFVSLTPNGLLFETNVAGRQEVEVAVQRGFVRPTPTGLHTLLHPGGQGGDGVGIAGLRISDAPDWRRWGDEGSSDPDGWAAALDAELELDLGEGPVLIRVRGVRWKEPVGGGTQGLFTLVEAEEATWQDVFGEGDRARGLQMTPSTTDRAIWSVAAFADSPVVAVHEGAEGNDPGPLWLRGEGHSWVSLAGIGWASPRVNESRVVRLPSGPEGTPRDEEGRLIGFGAELLVDRSGRIEVLVGRDDEGRLQPRELRVPVPAVRLTLPQAAFVGRDLLNPGYPPHESDAVRASDAVWVSPVALGVGAGHGRLHVSNRESEWELRTGTDVKATHFRRPARPYDTPPEWAVNDPDAGQRPSTLRGLFRYVLKSGARLAVSKAVVGTSGGVLVAAASPERPSFGLAPDALGVELTRPTAAGEALAYRHRYAVAALDGMYRSVAERVGTEPKTSLAATYVENRILEEGRDKDLSLIDSIQDPDPTDGEGGHQTITWGPAEVLPLLAGDEETGSQLVVEHYRLEDGAQGDVRRWGVQGALAIGGVPFEPTRLRLEGERYELTLIPERGRGWLGRLTLLLQRRERGVRIVTVRRSSWLRCPGSRVCVDPDQPYGPLVLEVSNLVLEGGAPGELAICGRKATIWRGRTPDRSRLDLRGWCVRVFRGAVGEGTARLRLDETGESQGGLFAIEANDDGLLERLEIEHVLPGLTLCERVIVTKEPSDSSEDERTPPARFELRTGGELVNAEINPHGHRVLVVYAAEPVRDPEGSDLTRPLVAFATDKALGAAADGEAPVAVKALTRVFLELGRIMGSGLEVIGGMIGWDGGGVFGLEPNVEGDRFPHVTLTWPALEPSLDPADVTAERLEPILELNGTWRCTHSNGDSDRHHMKVHCWDVEIPLRDRQSPFVPAETMFGVLIEHEIQLRRGDISGDRLSGFAYHTARVRETARLDLSATLFVEEDRDSASRIRFIGLRRRALKGFRADLDPPRRLRTQRDAHHPTFLVLQCGPHWQGALRDATADETGQTRLEFAPPLNWERGANHLESGRRWTAADPSGEGGRPSISWSGGSVGDTNGGDAVWVWSTLGTDNLWLPCPIREELDMGAAIRVARIWFVGRRQLRRLYTYPQGVSPSVEDVHRQLIRSGWHREAVLETWAVKETGASAPADSASGKKEQVFVPTWNLVDSPLLNRSISLARFARDPEPMSASIPMTSDRADIPQPLSPHRIGTPPVEIEVADSGAILLKAENATSFVVSRDVPFEIDSSTPLRGRLRGGRSTEPFSVLTNRGENESGTAGGNDPDADDTIPFPVSRAELYPARPRPGEEVIVGVSAMRSDPLELLGGGAIRQRVERHPFSESLEPPFPLRVDSEPYGALSRDVIYWATSGAPPEEEIGPGGHVVVRAQGGSVLFAKSPFTVWAFRGENSPPAFTLKANGILSEGNETPFAVQASWILEGGHEMGTTLPSSEEGSGPDVSVSVPWPESARGLRLFLQLPDKTDIGPDAAVRIEFGSFAASLPLHPGRAAAPALSGWVGFLAGSRLVAYGPAPASGWSPYVRGGSVRWYHHLVNWRSGAEEAITSGFHLTPSGTLVDLPISNSREP